MTCAVFKQKNLMKRTVPFENELVTLNGRIETLLLMAEEGSSK